MRNFRNYDVWKQSINFSVIIYKHVSTYPNCEEYGLKSQLKRAAVSIASNIAEGAAKNSDREFQRFIQISLGSAFEIETQLHIAYKVGFTNKETYLSLIDQIISIQKQLSKLIHALSQ